MKNISTKPFAFFLFAIFAACFALLALATGTQIKDLWSAIRTAYKTVPIVLLVWAGFVTWGWKWRFFQSWLVPFPCMEGTWHGVIQTTWKNPETGETPGPIPAILTVRQTFGRISCVMRTSEMTSRSYFADFWIDDNEQVRKLGYSYTSAPLATVAERSQPHDGTMVFELIDLPVKKLKGTYWTSRKTTGEVSLTFRCKQRLDEFPADLGVHPMQGS